MISLILTKTISKIQIIVKLMVKISLLDFKLYTDFSQAESHYFQSYVKVHILCKTENNGKIFFLMIYNIIYLPLTEALNSLVRSHLLYTWAQTDLKKQFT